jgi:predicted dehydrogenase
MRPLKTAMIGTGFMGKVHSENVRRLGYVEVAAVAGSSDARAKAFADSIGVSRSTGDWRTILDDKSIDAVHILTPNALHHPMAMAAMQAGKAVLCEKPLTVTADEARQMAAYAGENNIPNCVQHNLRYYPVVQHIRQMIAAGELGEILIVQGTYSQDWLLFDTDYNWRVEKGANGALRAIGDIGSHWMDMIQHLTGLKITALCAELQTFHRTRRKPRHSVETFTGKTLRAEDYDEIPIETEDFGAVLLRMGTKTRGCYTVSQMSSGNKNRFQFEIYGSRCGVSWNQERPDELWIGHRNSPNQVIMKDPSLLKGPAQGFADLPGGHSEGYDDSHKQIFKRFYAKVADPASPVDYPTFSEGAWGMHLIEKVLESSQKQAWVDC